MGWEAKAALIATTVGTIAAGGYAGFRAAESQKSGQLPSAEPLPVLREYPDLTSLVRRMRERVIPSIKLQMPDGSVLFCKPFQQEGLFYPPPESSMSAGYGDCGDPPALLRVATSVGIYGFNVPVPSVLK